MLSFASPYYLYLLLLLPLCVGLWVWSFMRSRAAEKRYAEPSLLHLLKPEASPKRRMWRGTFLLLATTSCIIAISRPRIPKQVDLSDKDKGFELMICMDISNSMYCRDIAPDRLEFSKNVLARLFNTLDGNRVGLVVFAGNAFTQIPITTDLSAAKQFLPEIDPSMISSQGTAIGKAIEMASNAFTANKHIGKAILIFTDGENHQDADGTPGNAMEQAEKALKEDIQVSVVGVGATSGGPIPLPEGNYLQDDTGQTVITRFDEKMCREIAAIGGGSFFSGGNISILSQAIRSYLDKLPKANVHQGAKAGYHEVFIYFLSFALLMLLIELFIFERKSRLIRRLKLFDR